MKQLTLAAVRFERYAKTTRRVAFLAEMGARGALVGAVGGSRAVLSDERTDLGASRVSAADQPPASTKRPKLIAMLEQPEDASVAEIGQRLG